MTTKKAEPRDWGERLGDWLAARWRWLLVAVVLVFALNNFVGIVVGGLGMIALVHRVSGRLLRARTIARQVHGFVDRPEDSGEDT